MRASKGRSTPSLVSATSKEERRVRQLLKERDELYRLESLKAIKWDEYLKRRSPIDSELEGIADAVIARELGIEFPLTVREEGAQEAMMSTHGDVGDHGHGFLSWHLEGYALRKDGSVGTRSTSQRLFGVSLLRRHLDDTWTPITNVRERSR